MKKRLAVAAIFLLGVGGCASSGGYMPVTSDTLNNAGEHVVKIGGYTKDASVAKEAELHNTLRWRDSMYQKAHAVSGFNLEFAMVSVGDTQAYLPSKISFKEAPHFDQPLPTEQSQHPVWGTVKSVGNNLINKTVIGWGISEGTSFLKSLVSTPTYQYQGPVNMANSYNQAGNDQSFDAAAQYQGPVEYAGSGEGSESAGVDVNGNACSGDTPILYEGTCYSVGSAEERGFPIN